MRDNYSQPFQLESSLLRGRIVRLGSVLDDILSAHDYRPPAMKMTGEVAILAALLSSMLKYEGIFTLQTQGDGPIRMLVSDMTSAGELRACASFDDERLADVDDGSDLLGTGYMAFTVDQGEHTDRYQGIVEMKNASLLDSVQHYFAQSEQISTGIMLAVGKRDGQWRGAGLMLQEMPPETDEYNRDRGEAGEDDWRRAMALLASVREDELLDPALSGDDLLYRLFHEEGIRIFEPLGLRKSCRCSAERVEAILAGMTDDDIEHMTIDGKIVMTCEFCSTSYVFDPDTIKREAIS